jgi:hypothetical protein
MAAPSGARDGVKDGALMEPSGRNHWQLVANGPPAKPAEMSENRALGCDQLP